VEFTLSLKAKCDELTEAGMDTKIASGGGRMGVTMDRYEVCRHNLQNLQQLHSLK
jgi:hypothetical protein